ncbi:MAG: helix-turn-helix domain-containing protein [Pseudonocardiaceae bacterium]
MEWTPARIRLLRETGLCLSQDKFAKALGFTKRTIGNAERGTHPPSLALRRALDEAVENASDAQRTRFLAATAQGPGAVPADRTPIGVQSIEHSLPHHSHLFPDLNLSTDVSDDARLVVTEETACDLRAVAVHYRRAYRAMPAAALLQASYAHLSLVLSLQPAWQAPPVRRVLLRSVGESAFLTAVLLFADLARYSDALPYLTLAQNAARENHDPDLTAVLLAGRAFFTSFSGDSPAVAADLAEAAVNVSIDDGASPTTQGWVAAVSSEQLAVLGDERGSRTRLDVARAAVAGQEPDPEFPGVGTFDVAKATAYEGGNLVRLGRYDDAIAVLDIALAALVPTMHRHRCAALIDRAEAYLAGGQVDASCNDAAMALSIAAYTGHTLSECIVSLPQRCQPRLRPPVGYGLRCWP